LRENAALFFYKKEIRCRNQEKEKEKNKIKKMRMGLRRHVKSI
jgi:hypothetical protein